MEPIQGKDALVSIQVEDIFIPLLCATEFTLTVSQDVVLATSVGTGLWRRKKLRQLSEWSLSLSGLTKVSDEDGQASWFYILQQQVRGTSQNIQIIYEDIDGNTAVFVGSVIIPEMSLTSSVTDFVTGDIEMQGDGAFEIENLPPAPPTGCADEFADTWDTVEGEFAISGPGREGRSFAGAFNIINVFREGDSLDPVDGTPGNREFHFDGTEITVNPLNPFNPGETIRVVWQTAGDES